MWQDVIDFWFTEISPKQWWNGGDEFDQLVTNRFQQTLADACSGKLQSWRQSALGCLAEIIVLDQFSRNIFRHSAAAFAQDPLALQLAEAAVAAGVLDELNDTERPFLLMPYMHSESADIHEQAVALFERYAPANLDFEYRHKAIIDRFGRYPHRNKILGRQSTAAELQFLTEPGSSF
jgi:uncharacterized protein (DUF924 family)